MKVISYNELFAQFKPSGYVSQDANSIANTLIFELYIQPGNGLARFLSVNIVY